MLKEKKDDHDLSTLEDKIEVNTAKDDRSPNLPKPPRLNDRSPSVRRLIQEMSHRDLSTSAASLDSKESSLEYSIASRDVRRLARAVSTLSLLIPKDALTSKIRTVNMSSSTSVTSDLTMASRQQRCTPTADDVNNSSFSRMPIDNASTPTQQQQPVQVVSDRKLSTLAFTLIKRRCGVPKKILKGNNLAIRLAKIFTFPVDMADDSEWLWDPLYHALLEGNKELANVHITAPAPLNDDSAESCSCATYASKSMPILSWLCQWKYLQFNYGWEGNHDIVSLLLGIGADPNIAVSTNVSPIFLAVKYGCLETIKLLVQHGANLKNKNSSGRSCLWNALSRPRPDIIRYLLEHPHLYATEKFTCRVGGKAHLMTAVDYILYTQCSLLASNNSNSKKSKRKKYLTSWYILGLPSEGDIIDTLIEFGRRGVCYTPKSLALSLFSFLLQGRESPTKEQLHCPHYASAKERLKRLLNFMIGRYLPTHQLLLLHEKKDKDHLEQEVQLLSDQKEQEQTEAKTQICTGDNLAEAVSCPIRLYCGHEFPLGYLLGRGDVTKNSDLTCPTCHTKLCLGLLTNGSHSERQIKLNSIYGEDWDGCFAGPRALTYHQLLMECQVHGIEIPELMGKERYKRRKSFDFSPPANNKNDNASNNTESYLIPINAGPAVIPIVVHGIPILAYLSMTSPLTLLSPEFVNSFGLQRIEPNNESMTNNNDDAQKTMHTIVDELRFQLIGDDDVANDTVEVCLRNALESTQLPIHIGIQLGLDFFRSGAWCVVDAAVQDLNGELSYSSMDGFGHTTVIINNDNEKKPKLIIDELRYYSRYEYDTNIDDSDDDHGEAVRLKILYLQSFDNAADDDNDDDTNINKASKMIQKNNDEMNMIISSNEKKGKECHWCCRVFPDMENCIIDATDYYCSTACRDAAEKVHEFKEDFPTLKE